MKFKLSKSTMLKVAAGIVLALTIICTAITIVVIPGAAPVVAGTGSAIALMFGQELVKAAINKCIDSCLEDDEEEEHAQSEYAYRYKKTTHTISKSDSGNHLNETTLQESGREQRTNCNNPTNKPHP